MSELSELLHTWPDEYEVLISVQGDGRFAATLCRNSSELAWAYGGSVVEAVTNLDAEAEAGWK